MSEIKNHMQNFLDEVGYSLGYDEKNLPTLHDIDIIWANRVHVWEYNGMTEDEYYWGSK